MVMSIENAGALVDPGLQKKEVGDMLKKKDEKVLIEIIDESGQNKGVRVEGERLYPGDCIEVRPGVASLLVGQKQARLIDKKKEKGARAQLLPRKSGTELLAEAGPEKEKK